MSFVPLSWQLKLVSGRSAENTQEQNQLSDRTQKYETKIEPTSIFNNIP